MKKNGVELIKLDANGFYSVLLVFHRFGLPTTQRASFIVKIQYRYRNRADV